MSKALVSFPASDEFREAITEAAKAQKLSRAELIRKAVATDIGYDLSNESRAGRPPTYESPEARRKAQSQRAKNKRQIQSRIMEMIRKCERQEDIQALLDSLENQI